ncbi:hypothetical protein [Burkholderia gladioli]|uniref:hypothetical protein n=1 Tax=Burkholderia gladioli TaxID=28095 RepID=UPI001917842F|nr:hypothetical protein [Burkholderia gladioli]
MAAVDVEPRNACIAPWLAFRAGRRSRRFAGGGPRGDGMGKPVAGVRAPAVARPGAATVAAADVELRNACIAPWLWFRAGRRSRRLAGGGPRGDGMGQPVAVFERRR